MILERTEYTLLCEFIADSAGTELGTTAVRAWATYQDGGETDDYVVIRVEGYYAIAKIIDEWQPIEIKELIQPFDEKRVYPLQRIKREITFVY